MTIDISPCLRLRIQRCVDRYAFDPSQKRDELGQWTTESGALHNANEFNKLLAPLGADPVQVLKTQKVHQTPEGKFGVRQDKQGWTIGNHTTSDIAEDDYEGLQETIQKLKDVNQVLTKHGHPEEKLGYDWEVEPDADELKEMDKQIETANAILRQYPGLPLASLQKGEDQYGAAEYAPNVDLDSLEQAHEDSQRANKILGKYDYLQKSKPIKPDADAPDYVSSIDPDELEPISDEVEEANDIIDRFPSLSHAMIEEERDSEGFITHLSSVDVESLKDAEKDLKKANKILSKYGIKPVGLTEEDGQYYPAIRDMDLGDLETKHEEVQKINKRLASFGMEPNVKLTLVESDGEEPEVEVSHDLDEIEGALDVLKAFRSKKRAAVEEDEPEKYSRSYGVSDLFKANLVLRPFQKGKDEDSRPRGKNSVIQSPTIHDYFHRSLEERELYGKKKSAAVGQRSLFDDDGDVIVTKKIVTETKPVVEERVSVRTIKKGHSKSEVQHRALKPTEHWITLHSHGGGGGSRVIVNSDGEITGGHASLVGKKLSDLFQKKPVEVPVEKTEVVTKVEKKVATRKDDSGMTPDERRQRWIDVGKSEDDASWMAKMSWQFLSPEEKELFKQVPERSAPEPVAKKEESRSPDLMLADRVAEKLNAGEKIDAKQFFQMANAAHGGTRADGTYGQSQAYDSLEYGVNKTLDGKTNPRVALDSAIEQADAMAKQINQLPTQTNRDGNKVDFQQFSTPPNYAFACNWVAGLHPGDQVLEPSAGTGCLAVHAKNSGADVYANELDPERAKFLSDLLGSDHVYIENAEQIAGILPDLGAPQFDAVVMNPPFSQTAGRMGDKKDVMEGAKHIEEAGLLLKDGGRLVSIVGGGMGVDSPRYRDWFQKMANAGYDLRANVLVDGDVYTKYGTKFDSRVLVFDKQASTDEPVLGEVKTIPELMELLKGVRDERARDPESSGQPDGTEDSEADAGDAHSDDHADAAIGGGVGGDAVAGGTRAPDGSETAIGGTPDAAVGLGGGTDDHGLGEFGTAPDGGAGDRGRASDGGTELAESGSRTGGKGKRRKGGSNPGRESIQQPVETHPEYRAPELVEFEDAAAKPVDQTNEGAVASENDLGDSLYDLYRPQSVRVKGAHAHPTAMVESAAMASVRPPKPTYHPMLSPDVIEQGMLSEVALESVVYAGQAHNQMLEANPDQPAMRRGYFIGDGTGCIAEGTRIFNPDTGKQTLIEDLFEQDSEHPVLSLTPDGFRRHMANAPYVKGVDDLYLVTLEDGQSVTVTNRHRFLTPQGWTRIVDGLDAGHFLACAASLPEYSSASGLSVRDAGDRHLSGKPEDCLGRCSGDCNPCDEPLPWDRDTDPELPPSQVDAEEHSLLSLQTDGPAISHTDSHRRFSSPRPPRSNSFPFLSRVRAEIAVLPDASSFRLSAESPQGDSRFPWSTDALQSGTSEPSDQLSLLEADYCPPVIESWHPSSEQWPQLTQPNSRISSLIQDTQCQTGTHLQSAGKCLHPVDSSVAFSSLYHSRWNRIQSIEWVGVDRYFDFHVPGPENYVAEGMVHHNSGKGREISGIITDNMNQGRKKAIWVSKSWGLMEDANRDWVDVGNDYTTKNVNGKNKKIGKALFDFDKIRNGGDNVPKEGIAFITYDTLRGKPGKGKEGETNVDRLVNWLGEDFDGVIAFDESHLMANALNKTGGRGVVNASQRALAGIELQNRLPLARIVYSSATGATEISNLAYADRLGIWGKGTAFPDKHDFIAKMDEGGVAAMEQVAQSLKATGSYCSRGLAMDDGTENGKVTYDRLTHHLTPDQHEQYDALADGWQNVLEHIDKALEFTGGKRGSAQSQFWGAQQRFFNQVMTSMQTPAVIEAMREDVKEGRSPVIQLVNTMEAATKRALQQKGDQEDADIDVSPRQVLLQYLEECFPTERYETTMDANGNEVQTMVMKVKRDESGKIMLGLDDKPLMEPVHDPRAVAIKNELIDGVDALRIPEPPIDQIIQAFGHDTVAEITGRKQRRLKLDDDVQSKFYPRNPAIANQADSDAFKNGKKQILIFSGAGSTGFSYHAGRDFANQGRRVHYMLQPGWRADEAVQGFGRTHRTNQSSAPHYRLVEIDELKGQKRFISTIARRLDQLGAITKGERKTGGGGLFKASDNLESKEAKEALEQFFTNLKNGRVEGLEHRDVLKQLGLLAKEESAKKSGKEMEMPEMPQFLNRMLSMRVGMQGKMFTAFEQHLDQTIQRAIAEGTLDTGMENYPAEHIRRDTDRVVYRDPKSGAEARHIKATVKVKTDRTSFRDVVSPEKYVKNRTSGQVWAVHKGIDKTDDKGNVTQQYVLTGPASRSYKSRHEVDGNPNDYRSRISKYDEIDKAEAQTQWNEQYDQIPEHSEKEAHFLTGALLPIWDRIPGTKPKVYRMKMDDGQTIVGRSVSTKDVPAMLQRMGIHEDAERPTHEQAHSKLSSGKHVAMLSNGWKLKSVMLQGEKRIELIGPSNLSEVRDVISDGVKKERVGGYDTRYFVPTGSEGVSVLERLTKNRPITEVTEMEAQRYSMAEATWEMRTRFVGAAVAVLHADQFPEPRKSMLAQSFERYAKRTIAKGQGSMFDEELHPRAVNGEFAEKESVSIDASLKSYIESCRNNFPPSAFDLDGPGPEYEEKILEMAKSDRNLDEEEKQTAADQEQDVNRDMLSRLSRDESLGRAASEVETWLQENGYQIDGQHNSRSSSSVYFEVSRPDLDDSIKIRLSDHLAPKGAGWNENSQSYHSEPDVNIVVSIPKWNEDWDWKKFDPKKDLDWSNWNSGVASTLSNGVGAFPESPKKRIESSAIASKQMQAGLFSKEDLTGQKQLFDTGNLQFEPKKSKGKSLFDTGPSTLEKIDDELKAKSIAPLAPQKDLFSRIESARIQHEIQKEAR